MILSLIPLLLICGLIVGVAQNCSVGFGATAQSKLEPADPVAMLRADAAMMGIAIRIPAGPNGAPEGWASNNGRTVDISTASGGIAKASVVGYLPHPNAYVALVQSAATPKEVVDAEIGGDDSLRADQGDDVDVDGRAWQTFTRDGRQAWTLVIDGVTIAVIGAESADTLRTLAAAIQDQEPIDLSSRPRSAPLTSLPAK